MISLSDLPKSERTEEVWDAHRLLARALRLDHEARIALEEAEAAFKKIGRPLPLFDRLDK